MTAGLPPFLQGENVRIKNHVELMKKLAAMQKGGHEKLQVISDFDYTISRYRDENNEKCFTTHAIFDHEVALIDPHLAEEMNALRDKFMAIEFDHKLTIEEKIPHMITWWTTAHDRISKYGFTKEILTRFVSHANVHLRRNFDSMLATLTKEDIPLIVFSAGLGDIIKLIFQHKYKNIPSNLHLISNMMVYNDEDRVIDFEPPLIHTFNKNATVIDGSHKFFDRLSSRPNILLMGDSLGDLHMATGVDNEEGANVIKIGFLNFDIERLLPDYLTGYDIVLIEENSMDVPISIIDGTCHE